MHVAYIEQNTSTQWLQQPAFRRFFQPLFVLLTLWLFNIAMENGPFIDDFPIKTSIYKEFFHGYMLNNQRVI